MRTIKFRAKSFDGEWVCGDLHLNCKFPHIHTEERRSIPIDPTTIGQLTGLHDRNGNEIYEGDILDVHIPYNSIGKEEHRTRVVVWNEEYASFEYQDKKGDCIADSVGAKCGVVYYMVIGNIHDNPELMKGGKQ